MKMSELNNKSNEELKNEVISLRKSQFNMRLQRGVGQPPQPHLFKETRKLIARIKTILRLREIKEGK